MKDIQRALHLERDEQLWTSIRESATELLKKAGILLLPATDSTVQNKKWATASALERLYPDVFGLVGGEARDQSLQKDTSYAILTSAMDMAKREHKKRGVSRGRSVREALPKGPMNRKSLASPAPSSPSHSPSASRPLPSAGGSMPPPAALVLKPKPLVPASASLASAPTPSPTVQGPIEMKDLALTFIFNAGGVEVYSPMHWSDLVPEGRDLPTLARVHENLVDDGLQVDINSYTLRSPDGHLIRSDRALNFELELYAEIGAKRTRWMVVLNGRHFLRM